MNGLFKVFDMLSRLDGPTAYIMIFTVCWPLVLAAIAAFVKPKRFIVRLILALVPIVNFLVFYLLNYTKGMLDVGNKRFGPHLIAAVGFCVVTIVFEKIKKKAIPVIITGVLTVAVSLWALVYVLGIHEAWHYGNYSHENYEESMASLIDELEEYYVLGAHKQIDYDMLRAEYIPRAAQADKDNDQTAFALAVTELCYEFHDGHLGCIIFDNDVDGEIMDHYVGNDYGFSMIRLDDGNIVAFLTGEETEAFQKGIHNGTVITKWDGVEVNEAASKVSCISGGAMTDINVIENETFFQPMFLAGKGGDTVSVGFLDDDGIEQEITLSSLGNYYNRLAVATYLFTSQLCAEFADPTLHHPLNLLSVKWPEEDIFVFSAMLDEHTGYLFIPDEQIDEYGDVFATLTGKYPEIKKQAVEEIESLRSQGMDRLVIDIRGNTGGYYVISNEFVSLFTDKEMIKYCGFADGEGFKADKHWIWETKADGRYSDIPTVVLVNAGTASCGDLLASDLASCDNVTMMGITTTWGCAQEAAGACLLSNGEIVVRYPIIATLEPDSTVSIDAGKDRVSNITPDVKIPLDQNAVDRIFEQGKDYELEYAMEYLNMKAA